MDWAQQPQALQFDGGTLKFGANFDLTRDVVATGGGILDINGYTKTQTFNITGTGSFGIKGGGTFTLNRTNSTNIGLVVGSSADTTRTVVNASNNMYLGDTTGSVTLNNGQLNLGAAIGGLAMVGFSVESRLVERCCSFMDEMDVLLRCKEAVLASGAHWYLAI